MRTLFSIAVFFSMVTPAFARDEGIVTIPEPSVLSLVGIGAVAYMIGRRGRK